LWSEATRLDVDENAVKLATLDTGV
jgi:hypothetical protein